MHRSVYFYSALAGFLAGVVLASFIHIPVFIVWTLVVIGGLCMLLSRPYAVLVGVVLLAGVVGIYRHSLVRPDDTVLYQFALEKADVSIDGYMEGGVKQSETGWSMYVRAKIVNGTAVDERFLVRLSQSPQWRYGDGLQVTGRIGRSASFDDFDYPAYLRKEGIRAVMIRPQIQNIQLELVWKEKLWIRGVRNIYNLRDAFSSSVRGSVPEPAASYLVGILVGGRGVMPANIIDDFSRTSMSHVLAISGYNITILAVVVMGVLTRWLGRHRALVMTTIIIVAFVIMTGASASVVRAAIMGVLLLVANALGRRASVGIVILISAVVMVWHNPLILRDDIGFQLSFTALCGLVWLEPIIRTRLGKIGEHPIGNIVAATTAAQLAVLPLILYYFHTLSVIGPLANLLVLPLVPFTMALGFATGIAGFILPVLGQIVGLLAWGLALYQLTVVQYLASISWSAFELYINVHIVIALYGILGIWWHLEKKPNSQYGNEALINNIHA